MSTDKRVRDYVTIGTTEDVSVHLAETRARFEALADSIWNKTHLQEAARVLPNVLNCIARQLRILESSMTLPIEVAASVCRTVFELNIRTRVMTANPSRIKEFWAERVFEEISLLEAFKRLSDSETPERSLQVVNERVDDLRRYAVKWALTKPTVESTFKLAELAGAAEEYKALYGFYSKYTHGTAWLVNSKESERDGEAYRTIFHVQTQLYAVDAYKRIEDFVLQQPPPT